MSANKGLLSIIMLLVFLISGCTQTSQVVEESLLFDSDRVLAIGDVMVMVEWDGQLFVGGRDGVFQINQQAFDFESFSPELDMTYVRAMIVDKDNVLWVGCENGLYRFNGDEVQHFTPEDGSLPDTRVNALFQDSQGRLWVGTWGGAAVLEHGIWTYYSSADGLLVDNVSVIDESFDGVMWLASYAVRGGGVTYGNVGAWQHFAVDDGLAHCDVTSISTYGKEIYIGAGIYDRGGLSILSYQESEWIWQNTITLDSELLLAGAKVRSLVVDGTYLWIGSEYDGLAVLNLDTWQSLIIVEGLPNPEVKRCYFDQMRGLWIGTRSGLLYLTDTEVQAIYQRINEK